MFAEVNGDYYFTEKGAINFIADTLEITIDEAKELFYMAVASGDLETLKQVNGELVSTNSSIT